MVDERTDPWTDAWHADPLFAFVERMDVADDGSDQSKVWVLDVVREKDVTFLFGGGKGARAELSFTVSAQVVVTTSMPPPPDLDGFAEGTWHRVRLGEPNGIKAVLYRDLDGATNVSTSLTVGTPPPPATGAALLTLVSIDDAPEANVTDLTALAATKGGAFLNVVQVGQGNCNALCDAGGVALLYFDLGAGCLQNAKTKPANLEFCFTAQPPVVLSHWDFDHWYGGSISTAESTAKPNWLAPNQPIGVRTRRFAATLINQNRLLRWPANHMAHIGPDLELVKCTGASKNDSGIALGVRTQGGIVLCPADAAFDHIPVPKIVSGQPLAGLVATHHGSGHVGNPVPKPGSNAALAFSFGTGNSYGHPAASRALYTAEGWIRHLDTPNGGVSLGGTPTPAPCGGGACSLTTTQS
jgi:hypothetical protein